MLHGVRNQDVRKIWIQCFTVISQKSRLASVIFSTKTSSAGLGSLHANRNMSAVSTLPRNNDEYLPAVDNSIASSLIRARWEAVLP